VSLEYAAEFQAALHESRLNELRDLLARTVRLQSKFLVQRLETSLPKLAAGAPAAERENIHRQIERLKQSGAGTFALIDYVNFKGEGLLETERYKGQGWGLLQVLQEMHGAGPGAAKEFAEAAAKVLIRRVQTRPPTAMSSSGCRGGRVAYGATRGRRGSPAWRSHF